jgi:hypothetical protein
MTEYLARHDDILTITTVVDDPVYLDEPYVQSTTYVYDPTASVQMETCNASAFAENGGTDRHHVPHFLPGQNTAWREWLKNEPWVPEAAAAREDDHPEHCAPVRMPLREGPSVPSSLTPSSAIRDQGPRDGEVRATGARQHLRFLMADGVNRRHRLT